MKAWFVAGVVGVLVLSTPVLAQAQKKASHHLFQEFVTARTHALMAKRAATLEQAHQHLHHVINCIVGPSAADFDAAAGTPCKGMGKGALHEDAVGPALHKALQAALAQAKAGLKSDDLKQVHADAAAVASALDSDKLMDGAGA